MKIDVVIKVGGSLGAWRGLRNLVDSIARWRGGKKVLLVPGGGVFSDLVRLEDRRWKLAEGVAHRMAILAMDQYGLLLSDLTSHARPVASLKAIGAVLRSGWLPVFLPSRSLLRRDPFDRTWDVTSDSIAAHIARRTRADALLLLKDVDGIFARDPKLDPNARLLRRVARSMLGRYECIDREFVKWVQGVGSCWILNGTKPARVREWLERGETLGTHVVTR